MKHKTRGGRVMQQWIVGGLGGGLRGLTTARTFTNQISHCVSHTNTITATSSLTFYDLHDAFIIKIFFMLWLVLIQRRQLIYFYFRDDSRKHISNIGKSQIVNILISKWHNSKVSRESKIQILRKKIYYSNKRKCLR